MQNLEIVSVSKEMVQIVRGNALERCSAHVLDYNGAEL